MTTIALLAALSPAIAGPPGDDATWSQIRNDVVFVECTEVAGEPWCRSTGLVGAPIAGVTESLKTMADHQDKFEAVASIRTLEPGTLHITLDYPSPLSDRDYVAKYAPSVDGERRIFAWTAVQHPEAPPVDGVVRLPKFSGSWQLEPSGTYTKVTYTWHAAVGGALPAWAYTTARRRAGHEALKDLALANGTTLIKQ